MSLAVAVPTGATTPVADISPYQRPPVRLFLVLMLLLVSSVAWRRGVYYSGGVDVVVVVKALLSLLALALTWTAPRTGPPWSRLRAGPVPWLGLYLAISCFGALMEGTALASAVLGGRVVLMTVTIVLLVRAYPWPTLVGTLAGAMLVLALVGSVTGVGTLASGRLYGGIPPLNANEISQLVSVPLVCLVWRCVNHAATTIEILSVPALLGIVWLTGTRTGLVVLLVAFLLLVATAPRIPAWLLSVCVLSVPAVLFVAALTPAVTEYATRGDEASTLTLNSRTVAWSAAAHYADTGLGQLFGSGLAVKEIPVSAMYRDEQILDSTWVSAVVQAGALGTLTLALMTLLTLVRALALRPPYRSLAFTVLLMLVLRSALESGLFDATAAFVPFLCFALCPERPAPQPVQQPQQPSEDP